MYGSALHFICCCFTHTYATHTYSIHELSIADRIKFVGSILLLLLFIALWTTNCCHVRDNASDYLIRQNSKSREKQSGFFALFFSCCLLRQYLMSKKRINTNNIIVFAVGRKTKSSQNKTTEAILAMPFADG